MEEKRRSKRMRYFGEVELDGFIRANLSDLSDAGAFIDCRMALSPGTRVQLRFTVLGREVETAAVVCHTSAGIGMGVKFVELAPEVRAEIARLVASGDADGEPGAS